MQQMTSNRFAISFLLGFLIVPFLYAQEKSDYTQTFEKLSEQPYIRWVISNSERQIALLGGTEFQKPDSLYLPDRSFEGVSIFSSPALPQSDYFLQLFKSQENNPLLFQLIHTYLFQIREVVIPSGMPEALLLVPAVCSGFNPESVNSLGGSGFWHLNYPQALKYRLSVTGELDERKNLIKSTEAALAYLSHLYELYGNWELALAAYACGPVTVNNLLERQSASTYLEIYDALPPAVRDLPAALLAMQQLWAQESEETTVHFLIPETDTVQISKKLAFSTLTAVLGTDPANLALLNATLLVPYFPTDFNAHIPKGLKLQLESQKDRLYAFQDSIVEAQKTALVPLAPAPDKESTIYRVKSGDVLGTIAERHGVRVRELQDWNNLRSTRIDIGQELIIYGSFPSAANTKTTSVSKSVEKSRLKPVTNSNSEYISYTVKSGDNLWSIARKFPGISAQNIMDLNGIDENLQVGQVLKIKIKQ